MKNRTTYRMSGHFFLCLLLCFAFSSCRLGCKKAEESILEKAIENAGGEGAKVDIDKDKTVIKSNEGTFEVNTEASKWPGEIPGDIPEFKFGKVKGVTTSDLNNTKTWNVLFEDVEEGFLEKYDARLKEKGFKTTVVKVDEKGGTISGENDKYMVFLMGGEGNVSVAVSVKGSE